MARTQARLLSSIWTDPDFIALTSQAQRLYLLLLSQPRMNLAGCLDVMPARWAKLSADGDLEAVHLALKELSEHRYVVAHEDELVVRTFVSHDLATGTVNGNLVKGMWSAWTGIMSPLLRKVVVDHMPPEVYDRKGVEVPAEAQRMRSEPPLELPLKPRFEPWSEPRFPTEDPGSGVSAGQTPQEPQSEPQSQPQSEPTATCYLLPATTPRKSENHSDSDPEPISELRDEQRPPDEQTIRKTASLIGRHVAATQAGIGNPAAYAAKVTADILGAPDGLDRQRITRMLTDGQDPEAIAETWGSDPFGLDLGSAPAGGGPDLKALYEANAERTRAQLANQHRDPPEATADSRAAARAALRGAAT